MRISTFIWKLLTLPALVAAGAAGIAEGRPVWFGTTTPQEGGSKGIYRADFDTESGKLSPATLAAEIGSPGFLALHPDGTKLYAVGDVPGGGGVAAYAIASDQGLERIGAQVIGDGGGTHLAVHPSGKMLITAQYGGGSVAVFPLDENGVLGPRAQLIVHEGGAGVVGDRQDSPHPHWTGFDKAGRFAFVPDLGLDGVVIYEVELSPPRLTRHGFAKAPPGGGPRHMAFSPDESFAYVLNELAVSVTTFRFDNSAGTLTPLATVPALSEETKRKETFNSASEIRVHPSGRFVFSANRGHDSITAFRANAESGALAVVETEPIRGGWPRNFNLDPSGRWLLAAGRDSDTITVFRIDQDTGELTYVREVIHVPSPICVLF